jgi:hypothetical protein
MVSTVRVRCCVLILKFLEARGHPPVCVVYVRFRSKLTVRRN